MPNRWLLWTFVTIVVIALLVFSRVSLHIGHIGNDKRDTLNTITSFHHYLDNQDFDMVYSLTDEVLRRSTSRDTLLQSMANTRTRWGRVENIKCQEVRVTPGAPVEIGVNCNVDFEFGHATESFEFVRRGNSILLLKYQIHSR